MAMTKLPILRPVTTGYRDAFVAIRAMPALAGYAFLIMLAINLSEFVIPTRAVESVIAGTILSLAVSAVQNFFLTPIMIAVHRYVILDEVTPKYLLAPGQKTFRAFFAWLMALSLNAMNATAITRRERDTTFGRFIGTAPGIPRSYAARELLASRVDVI